MIATAAPPRRAVVLAAGRGARLAPLTDHTAKPLVPFYGAPLIDFSVAHLVRAGVTWVAVNAHHLADQVAAYVEGPLADRYGGVAFHVSREPELMGTGGALTLLADHLSGGPFWVVNSDAVFVQDLSVVAAAHASAGHDATLLVSRQPELASMANVVTDADGRFAAIAPHAREGAATYCGVQLTGPGVLELLPRAPSCVLRQGVLPWIARGATVGTFETRAFWADLGTPERYLDAHLRGWPELDALRALGVFEAPTASSP
jgi:NDP-sugar pyrophosphorylase family protein